VSFRLGYNTSGFYRTQDFESVLRSIASLGFEGVEIAVDQAHYHPVHHGEERAASLGALCRELSLGVVLNTGGRYVLSDVTHEPGFVSTTKDARQAYLDFAIQTAAVAHHFPCEVLMTHSGYAPVGVEREQAFEWLVEGCKALAAAAAGHGLVVGFEFHPDMFIRTLSDYRRLASAVDHPAFKLTLDVGHVRCTDTRKISEVIRSVGPEIVNVHLEDIKGRVHKHLPIGQGDIDFVDVFDGLNAVGYTGLVGAEFNSKDLDCSELWLAENTKSVLDNALAKVGAI